MEQLSAPPSESHTIFRLCTETKPAIPEILIVPSVVTCFIRLALAAAAQIALLTPPASIPLHLLSVS